MYIRRKLRQRIYAGLIIIVLPIIIGIIIGAFTLPQKEASEEEVLPEQLSTFGMDPYDITSLQQLTIFVSPGRIHLTHNCTEVILATTLEKTEDISRGYTREYEERPDPYDLLETMVEEFDIAIEYVKISQLRDNIYYAELLMKQDTTLLNIDTKPSDAIALAVRFGTPVYMEQNLFQQYSKNKCEQ